jgi:hypothetical protein
VEPGLAEANLITYVRYPTDRAIQNVLICPGPGAIRRKLRRPTEDCSDDVSSMFALLLRPITPARQGVSSIY